MKFPTKAEWVFVFCLFNALFNFALFLRCYFPLKQGLDGHASVHDTPLEPVTGREGLPASHYRRLVLMVIDALRADFVVGDINFMPYTKQLLQERRGVVFLARAHPPTVTLPRIKSITTGSIPGFVDVVMNFGSTVLTEDNLMTQLKQAGKTLTFFGDDTWLNLFPDHFTRSDGTTSFFVTDYTEVDNNVTRHLSQELAASDWDVMTLHYLGLDHIGHLAGPTSPLIKPKLQEMDTVIQQIYSAMQSWSASESPGLLVICGDHGMSDQGGHGGASPGEVLVPVVLLSPHTVFQHQKSGYPDIDQIDLCPTLSALMGLPIPKNNLGCVEVAALPQNTSLRDKVRAMQINAAQLARMLEKNVGDASQDHAYQLYKAALQSHSEWLAGANSSSESSKQSSGNQVLLAYQDAAQRMSQRISKMSTRYDMYGISVAVTALWMRDTKPLSPVEMFLVCGTILHTLSLVSSSFVEEEHQTWYFITSSIHTLLLFRLPDSFAGKFAASASGGGTATSGHMRSGDVLGRMSGEREENYVQYTQLKEHSKHNPWLKREMERKTTEGRSLDKAFLKTAVSLVVILCILRVLRRWNQTGNKWLDVPDVGDWLVMPENKMALSALVAVSLLCNLLTNLSRLRTLGGRAACACAMMAVYCSKAGTGATLMPETLTGIVSTQGVTEARLAYSFILVLLVLNLHQLWKDNVSSHASSQSSVRVALSGLSEFLEGLQAFWLCLMCLLLRPHNTALVAMLSVLERLVCGYVLRSVKLRPVCLLLYCMALGQAFFFFQGNSNSVSTVDVAAGYTALQDYQPVLIGIQMCFSTYAGVIFWLISCLKYVLLVLPSDASVDHQWLADAHTDMAITLLLTRALPLAVYTTLVTFMRYHLFVWTVFSPKLLYEGMLTVVYSAFYVTCLCVAHSLRSKGQQ
ncbi:hypothetical protein BaRGS_00000366 [Batillaria attramentaria]|uniref:GPI ethanolamine phosphate transferase 2 C-terminal domain-containing protein n=1 Tax=Batillaria attramentaria TaxID=370345 RepID=A0ABD0M8S4_9CAEN